MEIKRNSSIIVCFKKNDKKKYCICLKTQALFLEIKLDNVEESLVFVDFVKLLSQGYCFARKKENRFEMLELHIKSCRYNSRYVDNIRFYTCNIYKQFGFVFIKPFNFDIIYFSFII